MLSSWLERGAGPARGSRRSARPRTPDTLFARLRRWTRRACFVALFLLASAVLAWGGWRGWHFANHSPYFAVQSVKLYGGDASLLSSSLIRELESDLSLDRLKGRNLFRVNETYLGARAGNNPKVHRVEVQKRFPDTLRLIVWERKPVALVNVGRVCQVDSQGVLLDYEDLADASNSNLPFISGVALKGLYPGNVVENLDFRTALDVLGRICTMNPRLHELVSEIHLDPVEGMRIYLKGGLEVRLDFRDPLGKMPALEEFLDNHPRWNEFAYVDLRFDGQLVYRPRNAPDV